MGRYAGPVCRLCRREGMKLFLKGARCYMAKCPIDQGQSAPGMHGARKNRKMSDYGLQLREKQRLRRQYGLQEGQFRRVYAEAIRRKGVTGDTLLQILETRLDNIIYRLGFAQSRAFARQLVRHGHVTVNGGKVNIPSYAVQVGDVVSIRGKENSKVMAKGAFDSATQRQMPAWLKIDADALSAEMLSVPTRDEIAPIVDEMLVVELYSR